MGILQIIQYACFPIIGFNLMVSLFNICAVAFGEGRIGEFYEKVGIRKLVLILIGLNTFIYIISFLFFSSY